MALINRFSRLFTADLHAVLDRMEEPEALLKQAVREMEEELECMHESARALQQELYRLATLETECEKSLGELDEELDICFESGEEQLARGLIKRKLELEQRVKLIGSQRAATSKKQAELVSTVNAAERDLATMRQKLELFVAATPEAIPQCFSGGLRINDDEVEIAFLKEKQRRVSS